jgi:electron transport complex protein RnfG
MNRFLHYGAVLLIIAGLAAGLLASANTATAPQIAKINAEIVNKARKEVLPEAKSFDEANAVEAEGLTFIPGLDENGNEAGYVVTVETNGYAGAIIFVLGLDSDAKVTGVKVTNQQETPGLGSKIGDAEWQKHWVGAGSDYAFDKGVDAFAGATISPQAVHTGMMNTIKVFEAEVKK